MILYSIFYFLANKQKIVTNFQKKGLNQKNKSAEYDPNFIFP